MNAARPSDRPPRRNNLRAHLRGPRRPMLAHCAAAAAWLLAACSGSGPPPGLVVGVASSVAGAFEAIAADWTAAGGGAIRITSASSSTLARQVERGSPVEVFVSADRAWVDYLLEAELGDPQSVRVLCGNRLVLYWTAGHAAGQAQEWARLRGTPIGPDETLLPSMVGARWSTGDPRHVPLGRYAKDALLELGWWPQLEPSLLPAADARGAVRLVEMGQVDFGVGYATDVPGPEWARRPLDPDLHAPIEVIVVGMRDASADAQAFLAFLRSPEAGSHLRAAGFLVGLAGGAAEGMTVETTGTGR